MAILPEQVWLKVKGFGDGRTGGTVETKPVGIGPNMPGPSGFRPTDTHFVGPLARSTATRCAALRVARLAGRETELSIPNSISL
jgi:hypothetical protein